MFLEDDRLRSCGQFCLFCNDASWLHILYHCSSLVYFPLNDSIFLIKMHLRPEQQSLAIEELLTKLHRRPRMSRYLHL